MGAGRPGLGLKVRERVCGPKFIMRCMDEGRTHGWKHYFLGGKEDVLNDLVGSMQPQFPGVEIAGWYSPLFVLYLLKKMSCWLR